MFSNITFTIEFIKGVLKEYYEDTDPENIFLEAELQKTKAKTIEGNDAYRPYYVCALYLLTFIIRSGAIKATGTDGIEWESIDKQVKRFINLQRQEDRNLKDIPYPYYPEELVDIPHTISGVIL